MEEITTSSEPEAVKDLLLLGNDKTLVSGAGAAPAGDVEAGASLLLPSNGYRAGPARAVDPPRGGGSPPLRHRHRCARWRVAQTASAIRA